VIKIENKLSGGDVTRQWKLPTESSNNSASAYFASVNWGKRSVFLDLTDPKDNAEANKIISTADILISNYKPGEDKKLGMDYSTIKKINPKIIYGHITGFGNKNKRVAYDLILQAETGFMSMNGTKESGPLKMPVAFIDLFAAHQMKEAILIALIKKIKTGKGGYYSVSLYDSAISSLANQGSNWLMANYRPGLNESLHPNIAPYGEIVTTKDGIQIVLAIGNDKQFKNLCSIIGKLELIKDNRFSTNPERVRFRKELLELLKKAFQQYKFQEIMPNLLIKQVPSAEIKNLSEVFDVPEAMTLILEENGLRTIKSVIFQEDE
jgi:crotonobetainyl-CoA:carnitine CoA-transferase CaiB-like acyl-CoA transferase